MELQFHPDPARKFLYPSSGVSYCTFGTGTWYTGLTTASVQNRDGTAAAAAAQETSASVGFIEK
jgi:hypothetical protein